MKTEILVPGTHSIFAPSSGHRIVVCGASLHATKDLPDEGSFEAIEGTVGHEIHEKCLKQRVSAIAFLGTVYEIQEHGRDYRIEVDEAMANYIQESVDWCLERDGEHFVEVRVRIDQWTPIPNQSGTCDHALIYVDEWGFYVLVITDLKYGKGVQVFAERNVQLALYALGFMDAYDWLYEFDRIEIRISQPRLDHRDVWEVTAAELYAFGDWIKGRFAIAYAPGAPYKPEKHACQFCKLKPHCPALAELSAEICEGLFDDLSRDRHNPMLPNTWPEFAPDVSAMTPAQLGAVNEHKSLVLGFMESVERRIVHVLMHEGEMPNWKLVEGRSRRRFTQEAQAVAYLVARHVPMNKIKIEKTISPAVAEKLLPKKERIGLAEFVSKSVGKPTLVPASDKRPKFALTPGMLFDDISDDEEIE
jgi:hypothetical protein